MSLTFPDVRRCVSIQDRIPVELPGSIFKHKQTGQLIGVLSCDKHQWCEIVSPSAARYECSVKTIHENYSKASKTNLTVTSRIERDCGGEFPVERRTYHVATSALVERLAEERMKVVS